MKLSPAQNALARRLIKAGNRGIDRDDMHDGTMRALLAAGIARYDTGRIILAAPTKQVRTGMTLRTVLDLDTR